MLQRVMSRFSIFCRNLFVSQCRKKSLSVSLFSGIGNIYASEGYVTIFDSLSNFFCLTVPKNLVGGIF